METFVILDQHSSHTDLKQMGGKAKNLHILSQAGLPIPPWFCLGSDIFAQAFDLIKSRLRGLNIQALSQQGPELLASVFPENKLSECLSQRLQPDMFYAVRSSAQGEDSLRDSFAGQFDTWLYVPPKDIVLHILHCWQSVFSIRLLTYLEQRNLDWQDIRLAVVVQEMIPAQASGVLFTANPMGALTEVVINAGPGLGEGIVSDLVVSDTYFYDRNTQQWNYEIRNKDFQIIGGVFGGTERIPVAHGQEKAAVLDPEQCLTLLELGQKVEALYSHYQDIEWAVDAQERFWILQSRPISTIHGGEKTLFDNSNVVESYPGLSSPLTFSWIRGAYEVLFRNAVLRLGVPSELVFAEQAVFKNMLGHLQGRVYYNLSHWYRMFRLLPGTEPYIQVWEEMMGISQASKIEKQGLNWKKNLWPWSKIALRLSRDFLLLSQQLRQFREHFQSIYQHFWGQDLTPLDAHGLLRMYQKLCSDLLYGWEITVLNDGYTFIFSGLTKHLLKKSGFSDTSGLFNDLLCGVAGMESVEPIRSVVAMAEQVRQQADLKELLQSALKHRQLEILQQKPAFAALLTEHLDLYGDRCLAELKLETTTLREDPSLLFRWVLEYADTDITVAAMEQHESLIHQQAEKRLSADTQLNPLLRPLLRYCLKQARNCINYREASRLDRARAFGMVRQIFRQLGARFASMGILEQAEDIFYLSIEEITPLVFGSGPIYPYSALVSARRQDYQLWQQHELPERILCQGPVGAQLLPLRHRSIESSDTLIKGTGCAPGVVIGEAMIITDPTEARDLRGKILVTEMTDPGWVFLMVQAAGLIVEKGSLLSHTAIIGRELGIPTVVGVSNATHRIKNGQRISLNGQTGEVELLS